MEALDKLIEAVEAGTWSGSLREVLDASRAINLTQFAQAWHGSLDAARDLHEALLPGWFCQMSVWSMHEPQIAKVTVGNDYIGTAPTPARAWLLAILRAYRSTQP